MAYSWFPLIIGTDNEGKPIKHPSYMGTERLSIDGKLWMCHDELLPERGLEKAKTATMPSALTLDAKLAAMTPELARVAVCTKDVAQTMNLLETANWKTVEADKVVEEVVTKG